MRMLIVLFASWTLAPAMDYHPQDAVHQDHRRTPLLEFNPRFQSVETGEGLAWAYLEANLSKYGIEGSELLQLVRVQESLLGVHYTFQQILGGVPVEGGTISISIEGGKNIYRVANNYYPVAGEFRLQQPQLSEDDAYDVAWFERGVVGELLEQPQIRLVYLAVDEGFNLTYITNLGVAEPFGYWEHRIDAISGKVIEVKSAAWTRVPVEPPPAYAGGPVSDRVAAFARFAKREAAAQALRATRAKAELRATGNANLFDPDPRTSLLDDNLQDNSPAGSFTAAYFPRTLLDIANNAGVFSLTGPWVNIINFEAPNTPPSTTPDGNWGGFTRGNNAFNDAMTYFHIDQSQRYMQSLGFTGPTGIQELSIGADSDGLNGDDNSHYIPASNRLAFGHGCVDDNEDQFVILHEYGHAIQRGIAGGNWSGGDTGGMGEGFGDYWGASYRWSTPNGPAYHPEWAFPWDGHGTGNQCWPGRIMNLTAAAQYNPALTYGAHATVGGVLSDQLWSTPLFQSLVMLTGMGELREEVDQIILESHFGIPSASRMRQMANIIIQTAQLLYPGEPHADVFIQKFLVHSIVEVPQVNMEVASVTVIDPGSNGFADPGETVQLKVALSNAGTLGSTNVSATLSTSNPDVTVDQGTSAYPDLGIGATEENTVDFQVTLDPKMVCGDTISFDLMIDFDDAMRGQTTLSFNLGTGSVIGVQASVSPNIPILDNQTIMSQIIVTGTGATVTAGFNVDMNISHTYIGDLLVTLQSPMGTTVTLHNRTGGTAKDIIGNYPNTLTPNQSLNAFLGQPVDGTWTLSINDNADQDQGTLNQWGINDILGYECEETDPCGTLIFEELWAIWSDPGQFIPGYDYNQNGHVDVADMINYLTLGCNQLE